MELRIVNTNNTAPYGIGEIMHAEPVNNLNAAATAYQAWVQENVAEGSSAPKGIVVDSCADDAGETYRNTYDAITGELIAD